MTQQAHPIATTSAVASSSLPTVSVTHKRRAFTHSPMVMAMITNNRMSNCQDVTAMVQECRASGADDRLCRTASKYFDICLQRDA